MGIMKISSEKMRYETYKKGILEEMKSANTIPEQVIAGEIASEQSEADQTILNQVTGPIMFNVTAPESISGSISESFSESVLPDKKRRYSKRHVKHNKKVNTKDMSKDMFKDMSTDMFVEEMPKKSKSKKSKSKKSKSRKGKSLIDFFIDTIDMSGGNKSMEELYIDDMTESKHGRPVDSMSPGFFLIALLGWFFIAFIWYKNIMFANLSSGMSVVESVAILVGMGVVFNIITYVINISWHRKTSSVVMTQLIVYGIYSGIAYFNFYKTEYAIILIISAIVGVLFGIYVKFRRFKSVKRKMRFSYLGVSYIISAAATIIIVIPLAYIVLLGVNRISHVAPTMRTEVEDEYDAIGENLEVLRNLYPENWEKLSLQKRVDVLQVYANIQCSIMGVDKPVVIGTTYLEKNTLGCYDDEEAKILIDADAVLNDSPEKLVNAIAHECRHASQYTWVRIYETIDDAYKDNIWVRSAGYLKDNFQYYCSGNSNMHEYMKQFCEEDAYDYGFAAQYRFYQILGGYEH